MFVNTRNDSPFPGLFMSSQVSESSDVASSTSHESYISLPQIYPFFSEILEENGYVTPTPIQRTSAERAIDGENLLLIASTGSGKTLAYLLPSLSRACHDAYQEGREKTVLMIAPTRELAAQLARDASLLVPDEENEENGKIIQNVLLAVRGIPPPTPRQIEDAMVLIGTPNELYAVLTRISGAQNFIAGDTLSGVILDEVDVLLPPTPKTLRTSFDKGNAAKRERKSMEQRRKLRAAQRRGVEFHGGSSIKGKAIDLSNSINSQVLTPTERVIRLVASGRFVGEEGGYGKGSVASVQVLAGSATASRSTLDRLNRVLRWAAMEGGVVGGEWMEGVWKGNVKVCRPDVSEGSSSEDSNDQENYETTKNNSSHTIRAVTVPEVVDHRYVKLTKEAVTDASEILANVAGLTKKLKPKTSLLFICGEFSRSILKEKKKEAPKILAKTSQARRNAKLRRVFVEREKEKSMKNSEGGLPEPLSVRKACTILQSMGVDARPMHVVLGLEPNADEGTNNEEDVENSVGEDDEENVIDLPPVLVTFEGSARGLHFDGVDVVFVVGRPTSAASYLHLAGRVGRAMSANEIEDGGAVGKVEIRPGTIISFCSKGRVAEMEKWTSQIGGTALEEIIIT